MMTTSVGTSSWPLGCVRSCGCLIIGILNDDVGLGYLWTGQSRSITLIKTISRSITRVGTGWLTVCCWKSSRWCSRIGSNWRNSTMKVRHNLCRWGNIVAITSMMRLNTYHLSAMRVMSCWSDLNRGEVLFLKGKRRGLSWWWCWCFKGWVGL